MEKEDSQKILKNKIDQEVKEAGPLEQFELKIFREQLTQEEIDEIKK